MRILALETTDKIGGVAAMDGDRLLLETPLNPAQRSAQSLAPAMAQLLERVGWRPNQLELVAVSIGPGSFTGLRVGVTTAKVLAYAVGAEVLGVNTLEIIASNADETTLPDGKISVVMDAQRGDVVVQSFSRRPDGWAKPIGDQHLLPAEDWLKSLSAGGIATVAGPGLVRLADRLPPGVSALGQELWRPQAGVVGRLAARDYALGRRDDLWQLVPRYYRRSAAEEKWDAKDKTP